MKPLTEADLEALEQEEDTTTLILAVPKLISEVRRLREALERHGVHDGERSREGWCASLNDTNRNGVVTRDGDPCDCGLAAALTGEDR